MSKINKELKKQLTAGEYIDINISDDEQYDDPYKKTDENILNEKRRSESFDQRGKKFSVNIGKGSSRGSQKGNIIGDPEMKFSEPIERQNTPENTSFHNDSKDPQGFWDMLYIVSKLSIGPIISMFFYMFVQLINTYYIGHTNDSTLIAGVGMGNMLINVLAFAIM